MSQIFYRKISIHTADGTDTYPDCSWHQEQSTGLHQTTIYNRDSQVVAVYPSNRIQKITFASVDLRKAARAAARELVKKYPSSKIDAVKELRNKFGLTLADSLGYINEALAITV